MLFHGEERENQSRGDAVADQIQEAVPIWAKPLDRSSFASSGPQGQRGGKQDGR